MKNYGVSEFRQNISSKGQSWREGEQEASLILLPVLVLTTFQLGKESVGLEWKNIVSDILLPWRQPKKPTKLSSPDFPKCSSLEICPFYPPALRIHFIKFKEFSRSCASVHWILTLKWAVIGSHPLCQMQALGMWWMPESYNLYGNPNSPLDCFRHVRRRWNQTTFRADDWNELLKIILWKAMVIIPELTFLI